MATGLDISVTDEDTPGASSSKKPMPRGAGTHEADPWRSSAEARSWRSDLAATATRRRGSAAARAVGARRARVEPREVDASSAGRAVEAARARTQDIFFSGKGTYPNGTVMRSRSARVGLEGELRTGLRVDAGRSEFEERLDSRARVDCGASGGCEARFPRNVSSSKKPYVSKPEALWATHRETAL